MLGLNLKNNRIICPRFSDLRVGEDVFKRGMSISRRADEAYVMAVAASLVPMPSNIMPEHDFAVAVQAHTAGREWNLTGGPYQSGFEKACASIGKS